MHFVFLISSLQTESYYIYTHAKEYVSLPTLCNHVISNIFLQKPHSPSPVFSTNVNLCPQVKSAISYIKMKVCEYVCPAACRRTYTSHHPKIWHGLLISPGLGTEPGGDPKCWPLGVPPIVTPSEKPWRVNNWVGASKQKLLLGVGLYLKILFVGGSPQPKARRVLRSICTTVPGGPASNIIILINHLLILNAHITQEWQPNLNTAIKGNQSFLQQKLILHILQIPTTY